MQPGDLISGKYRLQRLLGAGGMGSVWAARNELTDRDFAIKFLLPDLAQNKEALHRFFLEARACGQIKHPAIVDVYDMGQAEDGSPYLVMELLEGQGFDHALAQVGTFPPVDASAWIAFVARGLDEAHARGLIHRDLKPGNIFFSLDDRGDVIPKVLDFGVSKATGAGAPAGVKSGGDFVKTTTGAVLGSPAYMSPEQAKGETDVDGRSDVWSLGVILYEALTGQVPFDAPNYNALMVTIMMQPHKRVCDLNASVPVELSDVVDMALAKERSLRIATARELAERLDGVVAKLGGNYPQFSPRMTTMGLGNPSHPSLPDAFPSMPNAFPSRPPPGMTTPRPNVSTSGPWSDAAPTLRKPGKKRASTVWVVAIMLATFLLAGTVFAYSRLSTPIAAVAGRSAAALTTNLSRVEAQIRQLEADMAAEAKAAADAAAAKPTPSTAPAADPSAKGAARPSGSAPRKRLPSKDPHGGVDSAGF